MFQPDSEPKLPPRWTRCRGGGRIWRGVFAAGIWCGAVAWGSWFVARNWDGPIQMFRDQLWASLEGRIWKQSVEESFRTRTLSILSTKGNVLEVATARSVEKLCRQSEVRVPGLDRRVPGSLAETEIKVPATYRYHVKLDGDWQVRAVDTTGTIEVVAPSIEPTLPVAFDSSGWMTESRGTAFTALRQRSDVSELNASISRTLACRAESDRMKQAVREASRESVAKFVRNWLLDEGKWGEDGIVAIRVVFPDETHVDPACFPLTLVADVERAEVADLDAPRWELMPGWLEKLPEVARSQGWMAAGMAFPR